MKRGLLVVIRIIFLVIMLGILWYFFKQLDRIVQYLLIDSAFSVIIGIAIGYTWHRDFVEDFFEEDEYEYEDEEDDEYEYEEEDDDEYEYEEEEDEY